MQTTRRLAVLVLAVLALAGSLTLQQAPSASAVAAGACHRWAATGGSDAADGTAARPVRSLDRLVRLLAPGQVGCLQGGQTYHATEGYGMIKAGGGTDAAPVTITSGGTGRAKVLGQVDAGLVTHDIVFADLDFVGTTADANGSPTVPRATHINLRGDRLELRGNDITNPFGICINAGSMDAYNPVLTGEPSDGIVITGNKVHGCGMSPKMVWEDHHSGAHGIYLVWTRGAEVTHNLVVGNRYRGFQSWPRSEGTLVAHNLFDANATHVNLGSALKEGLPWHTAGTTVRDNIMVGRTDYRPEKNQASVVGNFPTGATYGNVVESNCIEATRGVAAGNGFVLGANDTSVPRFVDRARGDYRLTADSPCRGKGPSSIQPAAAPAPVPAPVRSVDLGAGRCGGGRLTVDLPARATSSVAGEWVFHRTDVLRWDGRGWVLVTPQTAWRYAWADGTGLAALTGGDGSRAQWVTHDGARTGSAAGAAVTVATTPGTWYAVQQSVWFASDGHLVQAWVDLGADGVICRT
jgi:hypothetical protein